MPGPFEPLRETLLRSGVAPAQVRRYVRELCEHFSDLVDEELESGRGPAEAQTAARARLGADEALACAMLAQPSLRSWTGRAPWATLVIAPFLMLILAWILACLGVVVLVGYPAHTHGLLPPPAWVPPEWLPREWEARLGAALLDLVQVGGPLVIVVALLGASLVWNADWPEIDPRDPIHRVSWSMSLGFRGAHRAFLRGASFSLADWSHGLPLVAFSLAVAAAVYWMARRRGLAAA
jgi:hypothetical protein